MFKKATLKLAVVYSLLFFLPFWAFSFGTYAWMRQNSAVKYITDRVQQAEQQGEHTGEVNDQTITTISTIVNIVALKRLKNILLVFNAILLLIIPEIAWFLARLTLAPVEKASKKEKRFVSDASHELRTPLTIIGGEIDVTLKKVRSNEEYARTLRNIKEETNQLTALVENLLFLSRQDSEGRKRQAMNLERVDLTDATANVVAALKPKSSQKNISINLTLGKESVTIDGNAAMLRQLLMNLIGNAISYTSQGGKIEVVLEKTEREVILKVSDTGIGISKEEQDKIFDRFYRVDPSRSQAKGYGLGLSICKIITDFHRGRISVESSLGNGSAFTVRFPL